MILQRMAHIAVWLGIFLCAFAPQTSPAVESCQAKLKVQKYSPTRDSFDHVIGKLRALGLNELLAPIDRGEVTISFRRAHRLVPGLPLQQVRGKRTLFGRQTLIVRRLDISDVKREQGAMWQVALALYQMQVEKRILTLRSMVPTQNQTKFALTPDGEDQILSYFLVEMPIQWRDERIAEIARLEDELYRLLASMDQWSDEDLLAKRDGGRWWLLSAATTADPTQWIRPNQRDYVRWKADSGLTLLQTLDRRHRHSMLFNYYFDYFKRYIVAMAATSIIAATPYLVEIPGQALQAYRYYQIAQTTEAGGDRLQEAYLRRLAEENIAERDALLQQITALQTSGGAQTQIEELQGQLADLCDSGFGLQCEISGTEPHS